MSSNRVPANQTKRVQTSLRQQRGQWTSIIPVLVLALGLGGCALNSVGLPGNLPVPPGGGSLAFSRTTLKDGIQGRSYTIWIPTSGGSGTLSTCSISAGALPAGLSIIQSNDAPFTSAVSFCKISGTITSVGPVTLSFTVQVTDTSANTASQTFSIFVRPGFVVTTATPFLDAVQGEHYGDTTQSKAPQPVVTNVSATVGNAPLNATAGVGCVFTVSGSSGFITTPLPTGGNTCGLSSGTTAVGAAGNFTVTLAATDSDLMDTFAGQTTKVVVPKKTISSAALALKVNPPLAASFNQSGNTNPASTLLDGVNLRSYGVITAGAGAPTWSVVGGLGAGTAGVANYSWCVSAGGASVTAAGLAGISTSCAAPTAGVTNVKLTSASAVTGVASFSVAITDAGNAAVISRTATQGTSVINALASLTASFVQGVVTPNTNPNSTLLDGVNLQSYGVITANAGAPKYTASGGLGAGTAGLTAYRWCVSAGDASVTAIGLGGISTNCGAPTTGSSVLLTSAAAATGAAAYSVQLTDLANAATPAGGPVTLGTSTINVRAAFTASFNQAGNTNPASTLLDGVDLRSYGVITAGAGAPTWTGAGGLGSGAAGPTNYQWCVSSGGAGVTTTSLSGISINCAAPTTSATGSVQLTSASATTGVASIAVAATDAGNEAAQSVTITQGTSTINILASLTAMVVVPDPATNDAVSGRSYGEAPLATPTYSTSSGIGALVYTVSAGAPPTGIACSQVAATMECKTTAPTVVTGATSGYTVRADDTGNAATPPGFVTLAKTITVKAALTFLSVNYANPLPAAVNGRSWGTGVGFTPLVYTAQDGLGGYSFAVSGTAFPTGFACATAAATFTCDTTTAGSVSGAAGPYNGILVNANDTANATTPSASASATQPPTQSRDITVNAQLSVALNATSPNPALATARAVLGRTYGIAPQAPVVYDVTGGLPAAAPPLYAITSSGTLITDTNIGCPGGSTSATCSSAAGVTKSTAGTGATLTVSATDTANSATPSGAASTAVQAFTIQPVLALAASFNDPMPDAVRGRTYGGLGFTSPVYTASDGLGTYLFSVPASSGTPAAAFPTPMACVAAPPTLTCSSGVITATAGNYTNVPVSVNDTGNLTTPGSASAIPAATATVTRTLTVRAEFTITTVAAFLPGVAGRTYGNPAAPDLRTPQPVNTDVSATVGNAPLTSCTFTVTAANPGFNLTPAPVGTTCPLSSGATTLTPAGGYSVSVSISDTAITDPVSSGTVVPAGTVNNSGAPLGLTVNAGITLALQQPNTVPITNALGTSVLKDGVDTLNYGTSGSSGANGAAFYTVLGGLGAGTYRWCISTGAEPGGFIVRGTPFPVSTTCAVVGSTAADAITLEAAPVAAGVGGPGSATFDFTVQVGDIGNAAVPDSFAAAATNTEKQATQVLIHPILSATFAQVLNTDPNSTLLDGVNGRSYGVINSNAGAPTYTAAGGLGNVVPANYGWCINNGGAQVAAQGFTSIDTSVGCTARTAGKVVQLATGSAVANASSFSTEVSDTGNAAVQASTVQLPAGALRTSLTIQPAITLALTQTTNGTPTTALLDAVESRAYGVSGGTPTYTAGGGLGVTAVANYRWCVSVGAIPSGFATSPAGANTACASPFSTGTNAITVLAAVAAGAAGGPFGFTIEVEDTGNTAVPVGTATQGTNLTIRAPLALVVDPDPANAATTTAVIGRPYGAPAGVSFLSPTYTASGGLTPYLMSAGAPGAGITCTVAAPTVTCDSGVSPNVVTSDPPASFDVDVTDTANAAVAAVAAPVKLTRTFTVNAALAITTGTTTGTLPNGLLNFTYSPPAGFTLLTNGGGIGTLKWVEPGVSSAPCPVPTGVFPLPPSSLNATTGILSGVPTSVSATATDFNFQVCVHDTANSTTPAGNSTSSYTVNVLDTLAFAADSGNDTVGVLNTTSNASPATSIPLTSGDAPAGVAVTPDGRKTYVTLNGFGVNDVAVIDNITFGVTIIGGLGTCTGPQGIAISVGPPALAFVACDNQQIAVIDASVNTFRSASNYGTAGATFYGVAISPDGSLVFVTDPKAGHDKVVVLNAGSCLAPTYTCTEVVGSPFAAGVTAPHGVIISADGKRAYIAGSGSNDVIVKDATIPPGTFPTVAGPISTGPGSSPEALAVTPNAFAVVSTTVRATNVVTITTTATHVFTVGQTVVIAGVTDTSFNGTFAITSTPTTTTFTYAQVAADTSSVGGTALAFGAHVYVTLQGTEQFAVFDDTLATPALTTAAPIVAGTGAVRATGVVTITTTAAHGFTVGQAVNIAGVTDASFDGTFVIVLTPTATTFTYAQLAADATSGSGTASFIGTLSPPLTPASTPWGVTIPPLLTVPFRVYIAQFSLNNVAIRDDETTTPFGVNGASPIALPPLLPHPMGIAHIPVPR